VIVVSEPVLAADGVGRTFGDVAVLDDVSIALQEGTLSAVIGPNGSGKTTLLRTLAGLLSPTAGSVTYSGPDARRRIGYMPQQPSFRPRFTARETLEFYTALVDDDPVRLLERVGLGDAGSRRVDELSGGMIRLLGLAQATAGDPPVVLLDEPGSGLDPGMRRRTFDTARGLADDGKAVLCSSHDLAIVAETCDQVLVLDGGSVVAAGAPSALLDEHGVTDLRELFSAVVDQPAGSVRVVGATE
jgi:ABC-type multidrug transport system ATPase subunit